VKKILSVAWLTFGGALAGNLYAQNVHAAGQSCDSLSKLELPDAKVTSAELVNGTFTPPAGATTWMVGDPSFYKQLPTFCRVKIESRPSSDSDIKIEAWLPVHDWNGKFRGQGNGGFAGEIDYHAMGLAVLQGYATAATDTGHVADGADAAWALGHPEKIIDFAYRAIHQMSVAGKAAAQALYGHVPNYAYFGSCSNGGRQALMEAQRYPADYDGILAGAPANYWTHLLASALWDAQATTNDAASYIPGGKVPAIAQAALAACDAKDGIKDGILNDPRECRFDPATMLCKARDNDSCLTTPQVATLKRLYEGARDSSGRQIFPGFVPGGEEGPGGWPLWITGKAPGKALLFAFGNGYFANMVYAKQDWDYKKANLDEAVAASDRKFAGALNSTQADMKTFQAHGGKLMIYHGWSDAAISPLNAINYYESVLATMGRDESDSFLRLYMVPGMQHCGGGPGADDFGEFGISQAKDPSHNIYLALEQWVEKGTVPTTIIASKQEGSGSTSKLTMTRLLCAYPQIAKYKGSGDTDDATNFVCKEIQ